MKKKIGKIAGITAGVLLAVVIIAGIVFSIVVGKMVGDGLLYCNAGNDTKTNSIKQLEEWGYNLEMFNQQYMQEMIQVTASDGVSVPAAVIRSTDSKNTVILVHGLGGDHVSMYPQAEIYLKNNWNVISIDQRNAGDSKEDKISFGYFEKLDIQAMVDYAKNEMESDKVVIHGESIGAAAAALYAATEHAEQNAEAVILDSCLDSMENMFLGVWRSEEGTEGIPEGYLIGCGDMYLKAKYGFGFADTNVCDKMKENKVSTLMLHMTGDDLVSTEKANEMFENVVAKDKKICYFDSEHVEGIVDYPDQYESAIFTFLKK